jgi:hypothetical protein
LDLPGDLLDVRGGEGLLLSFGIERPGQLPHGCGAERRFALVIDLEVRARKTHQRPNVSHAPEEGHVYLFGKLSGLAERIVLEGLSVEEYFIFGSTAADATFVGSDGDDNDAERAND